MIVQLETFTRRERTHIKISDAQTEGTLKLRLGDIITDAELRKPGLLVVEKIYYFEYFHYMQLYADISIRFTRKCCTF